MNIGLLCSGGLGLELLKEVSKSYRVVAVLTDKNSTPVVNFCTEYNIPLFVGNPRKGKGFSFIRDYVIDVLISVNYLFLVESDIISHPSKLSFNVHGSLLPKYRGRTPHVWAIINNETETGVTAHKIDEDCDTGDIISQINIPVASSDTGNDILLKFHKAYPKIVFEVLNKIEREELESTPQDHSRATYFGKRTPDDGRINWDWQKERIRNWVRAQAYPYPGAFTFYKNQKITIDEIQFSDAGYSYDMPNGMIIDENPLSVKTSNGVVVVPNIRERQIEFIKGEIMI